MTRMGVDVQLAEPITNVPYYDKHGILVRDSRLSDISYLKDKLRASDIKEIWDANHFDSVQALTYGHYLSSVCMTIVTDEPCGMFGIVPSPDDINKAIVWMLGADKLNALTKKAIKDSRHFIDSFLDLYPHLFNYVSADNKTSLRWLEFLGAEIGDAVPFGKEQKPFHYFAFMKRIII